MRLPASTKSRRPAGITVDLLGENLLVQDGRLAAVLDFGRLAVGDPAVDVIPAWDVLDAPAREDFQTTLELDVEKRPCGRAWALAIAVMTLLANHAGTLCQSSRHGESVLKDSTK